MESDVEITVSDYFGGCPHCGANHGFLNVRAEHWIVCDAHKLKWCVGSNLFSSWKDENERIWRRNETPKSFWAIPRWSRFPKVRGRAMPRLANGNSGQDGACSTNCSPLPPRARP